MIKIFFISAIRMIVRNKVSSFISIFGLSIGIACAILAGLYAKHEFSFDRFHDQHEHTYRLLYSSEDKSIQSPTFSATFLPEVRDKLPAIENAVRVKNSGGVFSYRGENIVVDKVVYTEPQFFELFSFKLMNGNIKDLDDPLKVLISESFAEKHFAEENPINKSLLYDNEHSFLITGIFEDLPQNTVFNADIIASYESRRQINSYEFDYWHNKGTQIYISLNDQVSEGKFLGDLIHAHNLVKPHYENEAIFNMEKLKDIHLYSYNNQWDGAIKKSDIKVVLGIIAFSLFILLISIINFSIIHATRLREKIEQLKVKKIIGANTMQLFGQISMENLVMVLLSTILSFNIIGLLYPFLSGVKALGIGTISPFSPIVLFYAFISLLIVFLIISIYPFLSILKISNLSPKSKRSPKWQKILVSSSVSLQFAFTIIIIVSSIIIYQQIKLVTQQKLGFDKDQLICIQNPWDSDMGSRYTRFRDASKKIAGVSQVTSTRNSPMENINNGGAFYMTSDHDTWVNAGRIRVENNFFKVIGASFAEGEDFNVNFEMNTNSIILNQAARNKIKETDVIGKEMIYPSIRKEPFVITGIISDLQHEKTLQATRPTVYFQSSKNMRGLPDIIVKLEATDYSDAIAGLKQLWKELAPQWPFRYEFMDDRINQVYKNERNALSFLTVLAVVSIVISCIGILGLSWMTIKQRTKEVGIRKVNGANIEDMLMLLNKDYIKWIAVGFVMASPVGWYAMDLWLQNFAYRITMHWWIFASAGLITLLIALVTVSYQTIKAALANPVEALRYE